MHVEVSFVGAIKADSSAPFGLCRNDRVYPFQQGASSGIRKRSSFITSQWLNRQILFYYSTVPLKRVRPRNVHRLVVDARDGHCLRPIGSFP